MFMRRTKWTHFNTTRNGVIFDISVQPTHSYFSLVYHVVRCLTTTLETQISLNL